MTSHGGTLFVIYNADGGVLNAVRDSFWKTFAPRSYPCALCALAFGFFVARREWKAFLSRVPQQIVELHRDDYRQRLPYLDADLPVIVLQDAEDVGGEESAIRLIVTAEEMGAMDDVTELVALARRRLSLSALE